MGDISKPTTIDMYDISRKKEYDDNYEKIFGHKSAIINKEINLDSFKNEKELDCKCNKKTGSFKKVTESKGRKRYPR